MKLWQKVFIGTFCLFEVLFNASSFYLIESSFNRNLRADIDRSLSDELIVQTQIQSDWTYISTNKQLLQSGTVQDFLKSNALKYTRYFNDSQVFLNIYDSDGKIVYEGFPGTISGARPELGSLPDSSRQYIIRDIGAHIYIFVYGRLPLTGTNLTLAYIRDISGVYDDKASQISLFFKINVAITIVLAGGLYALIWFITRSIRSLNVSARTIAGGDYSQRVPVLSHDEIGVLAESFNQMAEAVEGKVEELERTAEDRQMFINALTHELKTPLTAIIGYADFLLTSKYSEEVYFKALNYIYSEGKRLESLSFKLLDLILVGNRTPDMTEEDIAALCLEMEDAMRPQLETRQLLLRVEAEPYQMTLERDLIKLLFTNLIDNAIKASECGGIIALRGYVTEAAGYTVEVEDQGIGIPEENIARIFEPFFVVDKARSKESHSAGLGLSICAGIVRLHKGLIDVISRPGEGTTVKITFPRLYN